ncbi:MAG: hypothetical protein ACLQU2_26060 [Candidatus Binataceae bacterium]
MRTNNQHASRRPTIYRALPGKLSTASLSLSALSEGFERQELIGKSLAVVGDARLGAPLFERVVAGRSVKDRWLPN